MEELSRREALAAIGGVVVSLHFTSLRKTMFVEPTGPASHRIQVLRLKTHVLDEMREFYTKKLGFKLISATSDAFSVQAGLTKLEFSEAGKGAKPFYHFAFNIPENKIRQAYAWQAARTPIMTIPARLQADGYPDGVVDFSHWNSHAIYFLDPAGNVVEYIARHDLQNPGPGSFSTKDILCASEIALIVDDVDATAAKVGAVAGVEQYRGGDDQFRAMGDEHGLLLIMKRGRVLNFRPESKEKASEVFPTGVVANGKEAAEHDFPGFPYNLAIRQ